MSLAALIGVVLLTDIVAVVYFAASAGYDCYPDCTIAQEASGIAGVFVLPAVFLALVVFSGVRWLLRRRGGSH